MWSGVNIWAPTDIIGIIYQRKSLFRVDLTDEIALNIDPTDGDVEPVPASDQWTYVVGHYHSLI